MLRLASFLYSICQSNRLVGLRRCLSVEKREAERENQSATRKLVFKTVFEAFTYI
jgi:hypothetical protein